MRGVRRLTVGPLRIRLRAWPMTRHTRVRRIDVRVRGRGYVELRLDVSHLPEYGARSVSFHIHTGRAL